MDPRPSTHRSLKKKSSVADRRLLRAQVRSREQENRRRETMDRRRNLSPIVDTKENIKVNSAAERKRLALLKWKQERDLKKKLEREKKKEKPVFKVSTSLDYSIRPLPKVPKPEFKTSTLEAETKDAKRQTGKQVKQHPTSQYSTARRITRSMSSANTDMTSHHPNKEISTRKSTRTRHTSSNDAREGRLTRSTRSLKALDTSSKPASTGQNSSKQQAPGVNRLKTCTTGVKGSKTQTARVDSMECETAEVDNTKCHSGGVDNNKEKAASSASFDDEKALSDVFKNPSFNKVCSERSSKYSFAPSDFCFSMPDGFSCKPMSPASYADFMFPGIGASDPLFKVPQFVPKKTPKQGNYTNSLILKTLSPEEKDEVISRSPMVETRRRTPKQTSGKKTPVEPLPTFDDIDIESFPKMDKQAMDEAGKGLYSGPELSIPTSEGLFVIEEEESSDTNSVEASKQIDVNNAQCAETAGATVAEDPVPAVVIPLPYNTDNQPCQQQNAEKMDFETNINENTSSSFSAGLDMSNKEVLVADGKKGCSTEDLGKVLIVSKISDNERDVAYFRQTVQSEKDRLNFLCEKWNLKLSDEEIPETAQGQIRSAVGQAQLLVNKRFKQFSGLLDDCEFGTGEKEILASDLQGFWDVIYFQVDDVHEKFEHLLKLEANSWEQDKPKVQKKKVTKKKASINKSVKVSAGVKSKFADFRAKMKQQKTATEAHAASNELPIVEPDAGEVKTFDAGFFHVSSPVSSPKYHCEAGTPGKQPNSTSSLQRSVVMKRHSLSQSTSASPHLKALSLTCENSKPTIDAQAVFSVGHFPSVFTPDNSSTPLKQPQKSLRRSLRLLSLSNSFALSKSPTSLRKRKKSSVGNQSLDAEDQENTDDSAAQSSQSRRRFSSAPAEKTSVEDTLNKSPDKSAFKSVIENCHQNDMKTTALNNSCLSQSPRRTRRSVLLMSTSAMKTGVDQTAEHSVPLVDPGLLSRTTHIGNNSQRIDGVDDVLRLSIPKDSPKSLKQKSKRRSLRLQSLSNSFLSNTPKRLKRDMELLLCKQSLGAESKENLTLEESTARRRSSSAPGGNTVYNNLLFTPMEKTRCLLGKASIRDQNDQANPDGDLIAFSPL